MAIPAQKRFANVKDPGKYQKEYNKDSGSTRAVRMDKNPTFGTKSAVVFLDWDIDGIAADLEAAIKYELGPVMEKMVEEAKSLVQVGGGSEGAWEINPRTGNEQFNPRDPRKPYATGPHAGKPYTSRDPGRLEASIRQAVQTKKDRTAVIGFFEAGNDNTDYAFVEELGVPGVVGGTREGHAFLRPAFNKFADEAVRAIEKAVESL
jgi:hypothetical protein